MSKSKKRWAVSGVVVGSKYLGEFEANTAEEAVEMALNGPTAYVSLCHQCASECEDPEITDAIASEIIEDNADAAGREA